MRFRLYCLRENMIAFLRFVKNIKTFYKFWCDYEYNGEDCGFIIEQYTKILCNRTKIMSKPTYYAEDVIQQIDNWYKEMLENEGTENTVEVKVPATAIEIATHLINNTCTINELKMIAEHINVYCNGGK